MPYSPHPLFYFSLATFLVGVFGGLYLVIEWFRHRHQMVFMFYWGTATLLLNWFQIPILLALAGEKIVYTQFNFLFAVTTPMSFLAYVLVYFGIRRLTHALTKKWVYFLLFPWLSAALIFYGFQYRGVQVQTRAGLLVSIIFFFLPIQLLIFSAFIRIYIKKAMFTNGLSRMGLIILMLSPVMALSRYAFFVYKVFVLPPQFALILIRLSDFYILTQVLGLVLLLAGFLLIHDEALKNSPSAKV